MLLVKWLMEANCRAENSVVSGDSNTLQIVGLFLALSKKTLQPKAKLKVVHFQRSSH